MEVNYKTIFLTLLGYQLTWTFCVFGEYYNIPLAGLIMGVLYLTIFFYSINYKLRAFKICFVFSVIGYLFDSILGFSELFIIKSNIIVGYLPIWFLILWPSFSTLFVNILSFLKNRPILAFFFGNVICTTNLLLGHSIGYCKK
jgi:hypothetical protein